MKSTVRDNGWNLYIGDKPGRRDGLVAGLLLLGVGMTIPVRPKSDRDVRLLKRMGKQWHRRRLAIALLGF